MSKAPSGVDGGRAREHPALLDHIRADHDTVEQYVRTLGVEADHIKRLRAALVS